MLLPGVKPGVNQGLTAAVDLMPTVLDIAGKDIPDVKESIRANFQGIRVEV